MKNLHKRNMDIGKALDWEMTQKFEKRGNLDGSKWD
jgi:hypothetical protein